MENNSEQLSNISLDVNKMQQSLNHLHSNQHREAVSNTVDTNRDSFGRFTKFVGATVIGAMFLMLMKIMLVDAGAIKPLFGLGQ